MPRQVDAAQLPLLDSDSLSKNFTENAVLLQQDQKRTSSTKGHAQLRSLLGLFRFILMSDVTTCWPHNLSCAENRLTEHDLHGHLFVLHNIIQTCENYRRGVIWSFISFSFLFALLIQAIFFSAFWFCFCVAWQRIPRGHGT